MRQAGSRIGVPSFLFEVFNETVDYGQYCSKYIVNLRLRQLAIYLRTVYDSVAKIDDVV